MFVWSLRPILTERVWIRLFDGDCDCSCVWYVASISFFRVVLKVRPEYGLISAQLGLVGCGDAESVWPWSDPEFLLV